MHPLANPETHKMESGITVEYLTKLEEGYDHLLEEFKEFGIPMIDMDWNEFRPTNELVGDVVKAWESIQNVHRIPAKEAVRSRKKSYKCYLLHSLMIHFTFTLSITISTHQLQPTLSPSPGCTADLYRVGNCLRSPTVTP